MGDRQSIARVEGRPVRAVLTDATPYAVALLVAVVTGVATSMTGVTVTSLGGSGGEPLVVGFGAGVIALCCVAAWSVLRDPVEVRLFRDELAVGRRPGFLDRSDVVAYADVDLVVRTDDRDADATYELVRSGQSTVALRHVRDPETFERVLAERVPSPRERNRRANGADETDRPIEHERTFWRRWPSDASLPVTSVVGAASLPAAVDDGVQFRTDAGTTTGGNDIVHGDASVEDLARGQYADPGTSTNAGAVSPGTHGGGFGGDGGGDGGGM